METRTELAVLGTYVENQVILEPILLYRTSKCKQTKEKGSENCLWIHIFIFYRLFQIAVESRGMRGRGGGGGGGRNENFGGEGRRGGFNGRWEPEKECFWSFEPFPKLKTAFYEYWTSIEIKSSITYVSKEYKIKTKMVHEQWLQLKVLILLGYNSKTFI